METQSAHLSRIPEKKKTSFVYVCKHFEFFKLYVALIVAGVIRARTLNRQRFQLFRPTKIGSKLPAPRRRPAIMSRRKQSNPKPVKRKYPRFALLKAPLKKAIAVSGQIAQIECKPHANAQVKKLSGSLDNITARRAYRKLRKRCCDFAISHELIFKWLFASLLFQMT